MLSPIQPETADILAQQYFCKPFDSTHHGETFRIEDIPGRSGVLFHAGNIVEHTEGCILLGESVGKLKGERAVLNSGKTFAEFMDRAGGEPSLHLTVKTSY